MQIQPQEAYTSLNRKENHCGGREENYLSLKTTVVGVQKIQLIFNKKFDIIIIENELKISNEIFNPKFELKK